MDQIAAEVDGNRPGRRRRRVLGAGIALALVAGPLVGFELGQRLGDRDRVAVASETSDQVGDGGTTGADSSPAAPTSGDGPGAGGGFAADESRPYGHGYGHDLDPAGVVDVGGATIRLFRADFGPPATGNPTWEPPVGCFATGAVMAQASTPRMVAIVTGEVYGLRTTEGVVQLAGVAEGDPHWIAVGHTDAPAATVRFSDGQTVEAPVVDGAFTAAAPAVGADPRTEPMATVIAGGDEFPIRAWAGPVDDDFHQQCEAPPPALPPAGEQPADPDAARTAIVDAYALGYGGGEDQLDAFADPQAMAPVLEELDASEAFDSYRGRISAIVGEIVFDSPTHAWLFYDLDPVLTGSIGEAVLTDRGWKVANETICADVARTGVHCP